MGVRGLWSLLDPIQEQMPLRSLGGRKLAVDLSGWICGDMVVNEKAHTRIKLYLRTISEQKHPIRLQRRRLSQLSSQCCQILRGLGLPYIQCPGEAEATCAFLDSAELVDGCVTNDGDAFLYGASVVYRNFTLGVRNPSVTAYSSKRIGSELGLSRKSLIILGLILGCDFWPAGVPGVGPVSAVNLLSKIDSERALTSLQNLETFIPLSSVHLVDSQHPVHTCPVWRNVQNGLSQCPISQIVDEFLLPCEARNWKLPVQDDLVWTMPNVYSLVEKCIQLLDWQPNYALSLFVPVLALWIIRNRSENSGICAKDNAEITYPIRILRKRTVKFVPCYEVEWKRLSNDIWSNCAHLPDSAEGITNSSALSTFFTSEGYKFSLPVVEFRNGFYSMSCAFEAVGLPSLGDEFSKLSTKTSKTFSCSQSRTYKSRRKTKKQIGDHTKIKSSIIDRPVHLNRLSFDQDAYLAGWDSSPESKPLHEHDDDRNAAPFMSPEKLASVCRSPLNSVDFISFRVSTLYEGRLTLEASFLPPPTPPTDNGFADLCQFSTPPPLLDRIGQNHAVNLIHKESFSPC